MTLVRAVMLFCLLAVSAHGIVGQQNSYNTRLRLNEVDTLNRTACYHLEITSGSGIEWVLGSFNMAGFYDASAACYRSDSLLLDSRVYNHRLQDTISTTNQSFLNYRDSLGFLRINLEAQDQPAEFDTVRQIISDSSEWIAVIQICFDLKFDNILDPNTCMQFNFNTPDLQASLGVVPDLFTEWGGGLVYLNVVMNQVENIVPNQTRNSCFVLFENTPELCSDGIDNDENGLTDCLDTEGCSPGSITISEPTLTCVSVTGDLSISGAVGAQYSIDGGQNFGTDSIFPNIGPGLYDIIVQRNGIASCSRNQPIIVQQPNCENNDLLCADGIDNDQDGLVDCDDPDCFPIIQEIIIAHPDNCPTLDNGSISIVAGIPNQEVSIDDGATFQFGNFTNLTSGTYSIVLQNPNTSCQARDEVILSSTAECNSFDEICDDGLDNDMNGLIDCMDQVCQTNSNCISDGSIFGEVFIANSLVPNSSANGRLAINPESNQVLGIEDFEVYDRWGNQIHHIQNSSTNDPNHAWNGTFSGRPVRSGVYFYRAMLSSGNDRLSLSGDVTVIN